MILFNCFHFKMGTSLKGKNLLPERANSFLYEQFLIVWKINFITLSDPLNFAIFINRPYAIDRLNSDKQTSCA